MTDRIMEWLYESQQLADDADYGPWEAYGRGGVQSVKSLGSGGIVCHTGYGEDDERAGLDAKFIAESRTRLPQAVAALREVAELHQPSPYSYPDGSAPCRECNRSDGTGLNPTWWPCPTTQAIAEALGLEGDNDDDMG